MRILPAVTHQRIVAAALLLSALCGTTAWTPTPPGEDVTEDPSAILITQLHVFLTQMGDRLQVGEYYLVSNTGEQTYVGAQDPQTGERTTLAFTLPEGAAALSFDGPGLGERYLELKDGFADTQPIPPGTATVEILFSYELPYREGMQVERVFEVPVISIALLLAVEEGIALEGPGIVPAGTLDTQMGPTRSYTAGPRGAGESLVFSLTAEENAMPVAPAASKPARNAAQEASIGIVALAAAIAATRLVWRSPSPRPLPARARPLIEAIATLDARFEGREIKKEAYQQERQALKTQLHALLPDLGQPND
jgi:hypothetical protein